MAPSTYFTNSESFIDKLFTSGIIDKKMFSFSFGGSDEASKVMFGGFDLKYAKKNETVAWHKLSNTNYWTVKLTGAKLGNLTITTSTDQAIIDTGTSYILIPRFDFEQLQEVF